MFRRLQINNKNHNVTSQNATVEKTNSDSLKSRWKKCYYDYCESTSIHGIQYLGEKERPMLEKLFWMLIFLVFMYCCSILISNVYNKWNETPVIVSFSEKSTPVWQIPFPAVTICSETKEEKQHEFDFTKFYNYLLNHWENDGKITLDNDFKNISNFNYLRGLLQICGNYLTNEMIFPKLPDLNYFELLNKMAIPINNSYPFCQWRNKIGSCSKLLVKTYTDEGICFTFNGLSVDELYRPNTYQYKYYKKYLKTEKKNSLKWSLQNGYDSGSDMKSYPYRVLGAGSRPGFFIALQGLEKNMDYICRGAVQGFKIHLHSPDDVPRVSHQYIRIPFGKEVLISVKPSMITTSDGILNYTPEGRQCYFNNERYLKYFNIYTQGNCELECLSNYTLKQCGCVKFSMPRTSNMKVCNESKISCYDKAEDELLKEEFAQGLTDSTLNHRGKTKCHCLPACTSLAYNTEISQADFDLLNFAQSSKGLLEYYSKFDGLKMSRLIIFFKENQFITSKRSELYGLTDFLANCGGLLGLFSGFSFMSMVELIYHCTIRLWHNKRRV
ncbi:hypothetical protein ACFFRR_001294 [Megaselia abdita]